MASARCARVVRNSVFPGTVDLEHLHDFDLHHGVPRPGRDDLGADARYALFHDPCKRPEVIVEGVDDAIARLEPCATQGLRRRRCPGIRRVRPVETGAQGSHKSGEAPWDPESQIPQKERLSSAAPSALSCEGGAVSQYPPGSESLIDRCPRCRIFLVRAGMIPSVMKRPQKPGVEVFLALAPVHGFAILIIKRGLLFHTRFSWLLLSMRAQGELYSLLMTEGHLEAFPEWPPGQDHTGDEGRLR